MGEIERTLNHDVWETVCFLFLLTTEGTEIFTEITKDFFCVLCATFENSYLMERCFIKAISI